MDIHGLRNQAPFEFLTLLLIHHHSQKKVKSETHKNPINTLKKIEVKHNYVKVTIQEAQINW